MARRVVDPSAPAGLFVYVKICECFDSKYVTGKGRSTQTGWRHFIFYFREPRILGLICTKWRVATRFA